jgi:hypothetical protein
VRSGATETVLASVEDRCFGPGTNEEIFDPGGVHFDAVNGFVVVPMGSFCVGSCTYSSTHWVAAISGFAPLFEILTSYSPIGSVAFRVPSHPEGLQGTDHFDTYYGPLTASKDFSHAQPLRCNYPATIPQPGDYLEAGIVPDPPSRQGYYYVTAATYQGETRYGRKRENGVLSGRDPAGLPPCALATVGSVASLR